MRGIESGGLRLPALIAWPLLTAGVLAIIWTITQLGRPGTGTTILSAGPRIEDVRRIARLGVLRVQVADVIEGRTSGGRAVVLVRGDCDIAVDLDGIALAERNDEQRRARLRLPTPAPDRPRVDHSRTRVYAVEKTGLALLNPFADPRPQLLAESMRAAQDAVEQAVRNPEFVRQAKDRVGELLGAFYRELGWELTIEWH